MSEHQQTWRVGNHYGIHVYSGDEPVATFHDADDASRAVAAVNGSAQARDSDARRLYDASGDADAYIADLEAQVQRLAARADAVSLVMEESDRLAAELRRLRTVARHYSGSLVCAGDPDPDGPVVIVAWHGGVVSDAFAKWIPNHPYFSSLDTSDDRMHVRDAPRWRDLLALLESGVTLTRVQLSDNPDWSVDRTTVSQVTAAIRNAPPGSDVEDVVTAALQQWGA